MADKTKNNVVKIVVPIEKTTEVTSATPARALGAAPIRATGEIFRPIPRKWAPAWFYSALSWLGQTYYDASNAQRSFNIYLAGADVDPYRRLGSTRLFLIKYQRNEFFLSIAPDADSDAPLTGDLQFYPPTDAGILQMYEDLAASDIFPLVTHCYVPGKVDLAPSLQDQLSEKLVGYDPATGLRRILLGSAIAQVVPLGDFTQVHNEQVYDESPVIVPLATSLVYDVTTHNSVGAATFVLPVAYVVDQATQGQFAVNRFGATAAPQTDDAAPVFDYGETIVFAGGPGYDAAKATALQESSQIPINGTDHAFITTQFADTTAYTVITAESSVVTGVSALTCNALTPLAAFANQRIAGFYRDDDWDKSLGYPIYDYQGDNAQFAIANTAASIEPELVYDPSAPFLNGGNLPNVLAKFAAATYVLSSDALQAMIEGAGSYSAAAAAPGLSVMSAALQFDMSSDPSAGITNQLTVPVTATVTTTPQVGAVPVQASRETPAGARAPAARAGTAATAAARSQPIGIISKLPNEAILVPIGQGGNTPTTTPTPPSIVQVALNAFIPIEALLGTGITTVRIGTTFRLQLRAAETTHQHYRHMRPL